MSSTVKRRMFCYTLCLLFTPVVAGGPGVYMYDAPPPYPGIYETPPQQQSAAG